MQRFKTTIARLTVCIIALSLVLISVHADTVSKVDAATDTSTVRIPASFTFQRNLKYTDTVSPDVMYLQRFLNRVDATSLTATGAGSNSQLTNYFGPKTRSAVMRFQNIFKDEILKPAGLTQANGNVGAYTRKKLNELITRYPDSDTNSLIPSSATNGQTIDQVSENTNVSGNGSSQMQGNTITPRLEQPGQITDADVQAYLDSAPTEVPKPTIESVTPRIIPNEGTEIVLTGKNFNFVTAIYSNMGVSTTSQIVSASEIRIKLTDFNGFAGAKDFYDNSTQDIIIRLASEEVTSEQAAVVTFKFPYIRKGGLGQPRPEPDNTRTSANASSTNGIITDENQIDPELKKSDSDFAKAVGVGAAIIVAVAVIGSIAGAAAQAATQVATGIYPFGGLIVLIIPCLCSANWLLYVQDVRGIPMPLVFQPGLSLPHMNYIQRPGAYALGLFAPVGICLVYVGVGCAPVAVPTGTILRIGTSF